MSWPDDAQKALNVKVGNKFATYFFKTKKNAVCEVGIPDLVAWLCWVFPLVSISLLPASSF
jgi:hypothetical protein